MSVNRLVVNAEGPEVRVGVIQDGILSEYFLEPKLGRGTVGNIYRGKITRVLPGMQAAFVDLGSSVERAAFLYVADILGSGDSRHLFADADTGDDDSPARMSRKQAAARKIEELVKPGQQILVQIVKDPIGLKGARVTGFLSLPGRYSVFMPTVDQVGVSRRIASDKERKRLRKLVSKVCNNGKGGIIVRTAAEGALDQEIQDDVDYLIRLWGEIGRREKALKGPGLVYADLDLVLRTIRDLLGENTKEIIIDDREQFERARKFTSAFLPSAVDKIVHYDGRQPIFDHYGIEAQLRAALRRRVPLKSGGSLVIDQGEALTAIDINTGSFVGESDLEETVTRNNLEACKEVARQLRLRNIGGIIVIDFVDMDKEANRKKVWEAFHAALAADRSRCNITRISELGLIEMTRKRTRESLHQLLTEPCPDCEGSGRVKSAMTVAHEILRAIRRQGGADDAQSIDVECASQVEDVLRRLDRAYIDELEKKFQKRIVVTPMRNLKLSQYKIAGRLNVEVEAERERERERKRSRKSKNKNKNKAGGDATKHARAGKTTKGRRARGGAAKDRSNDSAEPDGVNAGKGTAGGDQREADQVTAGKADDAAASGTRKGSGRKARRAAQDTPGGESTANGGSRTASADPEDKDKAAGAGARARSRRSRSRRSGAQKPADSATADERGPS